MDDSTQAQAQTGPDPLWIILSIICFINEIIDWVGMIFNLTGVWEIIIFIIDIITLALVLIWQIMKKGIKSFIKENKIIILDLVLEFIPVVGDIFPGWLLTMLKLRKY